MPDDYDDYVDEVGKADPGLLADFLLLIVLAAALGCSAVVYAVFCAARSLVERYS